MTIGIVIYKKVGGNWAVTFFNLNYSQENQFVL